MKRLLQTALVVALTVLFIWLFIRNADLESVWQIMRAASPAWLLLAVVANVMALIFRTIRWRTLLDPDDPPPFYPTFFANTVGYMLSSILPVRAADFARPALLSRRTSHRFSGAFGTVLTERILDLGSILILFLYFFFRRQGELARDPQAAVWLNYLVRPAAVSAMLITAALAALLLGIYFFGARFRRVHEVLGRVIPKRFRESWMNMFDAFAGTLEITKHKSALWMVLLSTAGVWFCLSAQIYLAAIAVKRPLPFDATFFITGASTIGFAVPTPGGVGGMHKICQFVLSTFYRFDIDSSVAATVLFHLVGTIPVIVLGLTLFAREGLKWKDVTRAAEDETTSPPSS